MINLNDPYWQEFIELAAVCLVHGAQRQAMQAEAEQKELASTLTVSNPLPDEPTENLENADG